jgi:4'-phosphopantetheinyl transferase
MVFKAIGDLPRLPDAETPRGTVRFPAPDEVHVWFEDIDRGADAARPLLSSDECLRADRFRFDRDRDRFTAARAKLRLLLASYLGEEPRGYELGYGAQGKPFLAGAFAACGLEFNVSHTQGRAAYAFASGRPVGVDLERLVVVEDALDLAARFFAPAERAALEAVTPEQRSRSFLSGWTRKEAFVKALGQGLGFPLGRFEVSLSPQEPARLLGLEDGDPAAWTLAGFEPEEGYLAAVAVQGAGCKATLRGSLSGKDAPWSRSAPNGHPLERAQA